MRFNFFATHFGSHYPPIPKILQQIYGEGIKEDFEFIIQELNERWVLAEDIDQSCLENGGDKSNLGNVLICLKNPQGSFNNINDIEFVLIDFASVDIKDKWKYTYKQYEKELRTYCAK